MNKLFHALSKLFALFVESHGDAACTPTAFRSFHIYFVAIFICFLAMDIVSLFNKLISFFSRMRSQCALAPTRKGNIFSSEKFKIKYIEFTSRYIVFGVVECSRWGPKPNDHVKGKCWTFSRRAFRVPFFVANFRLVIGYSRSRCTTPCPAQPHVCYCPCVALTLANDCDTLNASWSGTELRWWFGLHFATAQVSIVWTKFANLIIDSGIVVLIPINCRIIVDFAPFF